jgi:hypothetical protein
MATGPQIIGETAAASETVISGSVSNIAVTHRSEPAATEPEFGGRDGPEPTRFGDWEKNGRCIDF